jgi:UDP-3-O-[3-hydroxymyristoyl] N-acetylglucosamine deacetylase
MHTALVQRLMRDRGAWELAYGYDPAPEPVAPRLLQLTPAHA